MLTRKIIVGLVISIIFSSSVVLGISLDLKIKSILRKTVANVSGFKGAAVVDASSGDLLGYYIPNEQLALHKEIMAATIANIVRDVSKASKRLGLKPKWFGIGLSNGDKLLIGYITSDIFLGSLYSSYSPIGTIKYQMRKAINKLRYTLWKNRG